jgi:hypothetical protein
VTIANVRQASQPSNIPRTSGPTSNGHSGEHLGTTPNPKLKYRAAQSASAFFSLPDDINPLILNQLGHDVFNLGHTSKYWNVTVREFLLEQKKSRTKLRKEYESEFRKDHRMSVIDACRDWLSPKTLKFINFDDSIHGKARSEELRTYKGPVDLVPPSKGSWITANLKSALAARGGNLTIIWISEQDADGIRSSIDAITAVPANGFVALNISSRALGTPNANELWCAISSHPVVTHITCYGDNAPQTGDTVVAWIKLLSKKNAIVSSFKLNHCRMDLQSSDALSTLLAAETGINELEIYENKTSAENVEQLFNAVCARNSKSDPQLKAYFAADNLKDFISEYDRDIFPLQGVYIRESGQPWMIEKDPI